MLQGTVGGVHRFYSHGDVAIRRGHELAQCRCPVSTWHQEQQDSVVSAARVDSTPAGRQGGWLAGGGPSLRASDDEQMERWKVGRRYLSLGSPQHVLLLLKDGVDALKELGALLGDPAKTSRNRLTTIHLGPEIKRREGMLS